MLNPWNWPAGAVILLIRFYRQFLSPVKGPCCRFIPTCSEYGLTAFRRFGFCKGAWLTFCRVMKCHPFYRGNLYDPVPELPSPKGKGTNSEIR